MRGCHAAFALLLFLTAPADNQGSEMYAYKALAGEPFLVQCDVPDTPYLYKPYSAQWSRHEGEEVINIAGSFSGISQEGNSLKFTPVEERHAGNYTCHNRTHTLHFLVDVLLRNASECRDYGASDVELTQGTNGSITCPGVACFSPTHNTSVRWYKWNKSSSVIQKNRSLEKRGLELHLKQVYSEDTAFFTCDYDLVDGIRWTVRRMLNVSALPPETRLRPHILRPYKHAIEEAEIGNPYTLACRVQFGFEKQPKRVIQWWVSYQDGQSEILNEMGSAQSSTHSHQETIITQRAHIRQVTRRHLTAFFTCFAQNSRGNSTATLHLIGKAPVRSLIVIFIGPVLVLLAVTVISVLFRIFRMEMFLLHRAYFPFSEAITEGKEYDAFVSCESSCTPEGEKMNVTAETLALYHFPRVLEQQWGYKLCLLERDVVPGGAYAEDVMRCIQRSRRVICLLSCGYLRSPRLYELESSLKSLKQDPQLRIILVWISSPPKDLRSFSIPPVVRSAFRVLPAINWSSNDDSMFWKALRIAMPITSLSTAVMSLS